MKNNQETNITTLEELNIAISKIKQYVNIRNQKNPISYIKEDFNPNETLKEIKQLLENIDLGQKEKTLDDNINAKIVFLNNNLENLLAFEGIEKLPEVKIEQIKESPEVKKDRKRIFDSQQKSTNTNEEVKSPESPKTERNKRSIFDTSTTTKELPNLKDALINIQEAKLQKSPSSESIQELNLKINEINQLITKKKDALSSDIRDIINTIETNKTNLENEYYPFNPEDAKEVGLGNLATTFLATLKKKYPKIELCSKENNNLLLFKDNKFFLKEIDLKNQQQVQVIKDAICNYEGLENTKNIANNININNNNAVLGNYNVLNLSNRIVANTANNLEKFAKNIFSSISNSINKNIGERVLGWFNPSKIGIKNPNQYIKGLNHILIPDNNTDQNRTNQDPEIEQFIIKEKELTKNLLEKDKTIWPFAENLYKEFLTKYTEFSKDSDKIMLPTNSELTQTSFNNEEKERIMDFLVKTFPDFGEKICNNFLENNHNKVDFNSNKNKFFRYLPSCILGTASTVVASSIFGFIPIAGVAIASGVAYLASDSIKATFDGVCDKVYNGINKIAKNIFSSNDKKQSVFDIKPTIVESYPKSEAGQEQEIEKYISGYFSSKKSFNSQSTQDTTNENNRQSTQDTTKTAGSNPQSPTNEFSNPFFNGNQKSTNNTSWQVI